MRRPGILEAMKTLLAHEPASLSKICSKLTPPLLTLCSQGRSCPIGWRPRLGYLIQSLPPSVGVYAAGCRVTKKAEGTACRSAWLRSKVETLPDFIGIAEPLGLSPQRCRGRHSTVETSRTRSRGQRRNLRFHQGAKRLQSLYYLLLKL